MMRSWKNNILINTKKILHSHLVSNLLPKLLNLLLPTYLLASTLLIPPIFPTPCELPNRHKHPLWFVHLMLLPSIMRQIFLRLPLHPRPLNQLSDLGLPTIISPWTQLLSVRRSSLMMIMCGWSHSFLPSAPPANK